MDPPPPRSRVTLQGRFKQPLGFEDLLTGQVNPEPCPGAAAAPSLRSWIGTGTHEQGSDAFEQQYKKGGKEQGRKQGADAFEQQYKKGKEILMLSLRSKQTKLFCECAALDAAASQKHSVSLMTSQRWQSCSADVVIMSAA